MPKEMKEIHERIMDNRTQMLFKQMFPGQLLTEELITEYRLAKTLFDRIAGGPAPAALLVFVGMRTMGKDRENINPRTIKDDYDQVLWPFHLLKGEEQEKPKKKVTVGG